MAFVDERSGSMDVVRDNVISYATEISSADASGTFYRGYLVETLAAESSFEEVVYLLWLGRLPRGRELDDFTKRLWSQLPLPANSFAWFHGLPIDVHPMDFLHAVIAGLCLHDPDANVVDRKANLAKATRLLARVVTIVSALHRVRSSQWPIQPAPHQSIAWNILYMLHAREPKPDAVRALDAYLVLNAERADDASTLSARVTSSTRSGVYSSVMAALGTMKGPLNGIGSEPVSAMLREIRSVDRVAAYLDTALNARRTIAGFTSRPEAEVAPAALLLKDLSNKLVEGTPSSVPLEIAIAIEEELAKRGPFVATIDLYSATLLDALRVPSDLSSAIGAIGRISGWCAHIFEQYDQNKLYRAQVSYIGGPLGRYPR